MLAPVLLIFLILAIFPTIIIFRYSLQPFADGKVLIGYTFNHYKEIILSEYYRNILFRTLKISISVTTIITLLSYPLAYTAVRGSKLIGRIIVVTVLAPMSIDIVIRTFGWFLILREEGWLNTVLIGSGLVNKPVDLLFNEMAIVIGLVHISLPFMVFPLISIFHTIPVSLEESAQNLGANRLIVFTKILLPLSLPGIVSGAITVFAITMASYVTPFILGGGTNVLATIITQTFLTTPNWPLASAIAIELLLVSITIIASFLWITNLAAGSKNGGIEYENTTN